MGRFKNVPAKRFVILVLVVAMSFSTSAYADIVDRLGKLIDKQEYAKAVEVGEKYLAKKADASDAKEVRSLVMKADYEITKKTDTLAGYEAFEKKYPNGSFQDDLNERKSKAYYREIMLPAGNIAAYKDFRNRFPRSSLVPEALKLEWDLAWKEAEAKNTIEAWNYFQTTYPDCPRAAEALQRETGLAWKSASEIGTIDAIEAFAKKYSNTAKGKEAQDRVCEIAWGHARGHDTIAGYRLFQEKYSYCPQVEQAKEKEVQLFRKSIEQMALTTTLQGYKLWVLSLAFSPDGALLASGGWDESKNTVKLWDVSSGREIKTLNSRAFFVFSVAFSSDGHLLASGGCKEGRVDAEKNELFCSKNGVVELWDVSTGNRIREFVGHEATVYSVAFSPDGKLLASAGGDSLIKIWDVSTGKELYTLTGHDSWVFSVAFSPDGRTLASGGNDNTVRLWDVSTGKELRNLRGHSAPVWAVAFSPDGQTLASGGEDYLTLWNVSQGSVIRQLPVHTSSIAFSGDGKMLVSGSWDSTVQLWDYSSGSVTKTFTGHRSKVRAVAFNPNGRVLASSGEDNTIKLWGSAGEQLRSTPITSAGTFHDVVEDRDRPGIIYAATDLRGIMKSLDGGKNWNPTGWSQGVVKRVFSTKGAVWGLTQDKGVVFTNDGGATWKNLPMPEAGLKCSSASIPNSNAIYVGTNAGLFSTSDGGKSWNLLTSRGQPIEWVDADMNTPDRVMAVTTKGEARISNTGGKDWTNVLTDKSVTRTFVISGAPDLIFASRSKGAVLRSADRGAHWTAIPEIQGETKWVKEIQDSPQKLILLTDTGLYKSEDGGQKWAFVRSSDGKNLQSVAVLGNGNVVIGGAGEVKYPTSVVGIIPLGDVNFQTGSAELTPQAKTVLARIVAQLREKPGLGIRIEGYTDNVGGETFNQDLSRKRAQSVMNYLVQNGIAGKRFDVRGYGMQFPVSTNDTEEGRAKNRRVVIYILE